MRRVVYPVVISTEGIRTAPAIVTYDDSGQIAAIDRFIGETAFTVSIPEILDLRMQSGDSAGNQALSSRDKA